VVMNSFINTCIVKIKVPLIMAALIISACVFAGCNRAESEAESDINIVTTIFPAYDFARNIAGEKASVSQLLKPGVESHSYEPTPQDIVLLKKCDIFIYAGGASDTWIESIIDSVDMSDKVVISMMDCVDVLDEEEKDGMQEGGVLSFIFEEEEEADEHVWTSTVNAIKISEGICNALKEIDSQNSEYYDKNFEEYKAELLELDGEFRSVTDTAKRNTIAVADRFPFRYLCEEYGLNYYAVFPGCSEDAEVTAKSLITLADNVEREQIPAVFYIDFSNEKIADTIVEVAGVRKLRLSSCHNLSEEELKEGATYISIMRENVKALSEALN